MPVRFRSHLTQTMTTPRIILASASPRRRELLDQLGMDYQVWPAELEECPGADETPEAYVARIAQEKSAAVWQRSGADKPVLAADTEVELDGMIFGKPENYAHAREMLERLSGRTHRVLSGVSLRGVQGHATCLSISQVTFKPLSSDEIAAYWDSREPLGKAGAYAIQGHGARFISHLTGSYSGVVGLPLYETAELLTRWGLL